MRKLQRIRGFTLLELIVVIGIIVILLTIVLVNLFQTRGKTSDLAVIRNLNDLQTYANEYFLDKNSLDGFCSSDRAQIYLTNAGQDIDRVCDGPGDHWCSYAELKNDSGKVYCVDSTGKRGKFPKTATIGLGGCADPEYSCP